ncbi:MAG: ABC transporter permease [Sedimentisphaerales bacterium]|nr:ABC transporter permease [Sedimentisphaerales bacterium]
MKKVFFLAAKDIRVLMSDRGNIFWVLGFPLIFAFFFGAIYSDAGDGPSGMKIAVVDEDNSSFSTSYISKLEESDALTVIHLERDQALEQVRKSKIAAAVIIKKGMGDGFEAIFNRDEPKIEIAADPSRKMESGYLQGLLAKAQFEALSGNFTDKNWMQDQVSQWREEIEEANDIDTKDANLYLDLFDSYDNFFNDINDQDLKMGFDGDILNFSQTNLSRESDGPLTPFQITFPQAILWGILGCAATFAISIVKERTSGTFQRLLIGPIGKAHILAGKGAACFITCSFIMCIQYIGAKLFFKMPVGNLSFFVLAYFCTIFCFVGLMMLISTLGRTEQSAGGAGWAIIMIMAMLGGGMMPLYFMPVWLRPFSNFSPVKWGIYALEGAIWRNFSLIEMSTPCLILLAIGLASFLLGVYNLHRQED